MIICGMNVENVFPVHSKKQGEGYKIRASVYIDGKNKQPQEIFYNTTGLKDVELLFKIKEIKEKLKNEVITGEAKKRNALPKTFGEIALEQLASKEATSDSNYASQKRIIDDLIDKFGPRYFKTITEAELEAFVIKQNDRSYSESVAKATDKGRIVLLGIEKDKNKHKILNDKQISYGVLRNARKGLNISQNSAEKLCKAFELNYNEIFYDSTEIKKYAEETLERGVQAIISIFERAKRAKLIEEIPIVKDSKGRYKLFEKVQGNPPEVKEILNMKEYAHFRAALDKMSIIDAIPFEILWQTGIRCCEMLGLNWTDVDFDNDIIHIRFNRVFKKGEGLVREGTKTEASIRDVPMWSRLKTKLQEYWELYKTLPDDNPLFNHCDAVFCDINGNPKGSRNINAVLSRILFNADCKIVTAHSLRHGWITYLDRMGFKPKEIMQLAGHSRIDTTMRYIHTRAQKQIFKHFGLVNPENQQPQKVLLEAFDDDDDVIPF